MCSKSRGTLDLIRNANEEVQVIEYLKTPPTKAELTGILAKLNLKPQELIRKGEKVYKENYAGQTLTDEEWLDAMVQHPALIERPIVVKGDKAVIGRPPENVLSIL